MLYTFQMHSMVNILMLHSFGCFAYFGYIFLLVDAILLELINSDFLLGSNFLRSNWYVMMNPIKTSTFQTYSEYDSLLKRTIRFQGNLLRSSGRGLMDDSFDSHLETLFNGIHTQKLTFCHWKISSWKTNFLFKWSLFRGHLNFREFHYYINWWRNALGIRGVLVQPSPETLSVDSPQWIAWTERLNIFFFQRIHPRNILKIKLIKKKNTWTHHFNGCWNGVGMLVPLKGGIGDIVHPPVLAEPGGLYATDPTF